MADFDDIPGTWANELKKHFDAFSEVCEFMRKEGHKNAVDKMKWREYVLWDMQKKHDEEKNKQ